jgi:DNA-binding protein HU-alpha
MTRWQGDVTMDQDMDQDSGIGSAEKPARKPRGKRAAAQSGKAETVTSGGDAAAASPYKTRDLVDRVAKASGLKRRAAKPLVETVLAELGAVLSEGRPMALRPLGKITVARTREAGGGQVLICRIRQRGAKGGETADMGPDAALAEVAEGS